MCGQLLALMRSRLLNVASRLLRALQHVEGGAGGVRLLHDDLVGWGALCPKVIFRHFLLLLTSQHAL